jgi:hypothetical protein
MTELERALVLLGRELDVPPAPNLAVAVRPRLARRRRRWWPVAVALAAALAVAFAVPGSRAALLRFFHLRGAEVRIVDRLPAMPGGGLQLGGPTTLEELGFRALLLDGQKPDAVYRRDGVAWLRYGPVDRPRALLAELPNSGGSFLKKVAGGATSVEYVLVGRYPGIWIAGGHALFLPGGDAQLAGRTLIWEHGALTLRLEADVSREEAVRLALTVR